MNNVRDVSGSQPRLLTSLPLVLILKYKPRATRLTSMTLEENISSGFLPARSTIRAATAVIIICRKRRFQVNIIITAIKQLIIIAGDIAAGIRISDTYRADNDYHMKFDYEKQRRKKSARSNSYKITLATINSQT